MVGYLAPCAFYMPFVSFNLMYLLYLVLCKCNSYFAPYTIPSSLFSCFFLLSASLKENFNFVVHSIISKCRTMPVFSRVTSGRVSPSDLPDSPSQTMPGSPRVEPRHHHLTRHGKPLKPPLSAQPVKPVFEDGVRTFQVRPSFIGKCKLFSTFCKASLFLKLYQCFGSGFIESGPRSNILGRLPIRIQDFFDKFFFLNYGTVEIFFFFKNCNLLILRPP